MRLLDLDLQAFGPFTDQLLDFRGSEQGLHVLFGRNETGKSSALRAVDNLLYGIPERTRDAFLHPPTKLRIGAHIVHSDGTELAVVRRKGRKNVLLNFEGDVLDPASLDRYLAGVQRELFGSMFGIDQDGLVAGGEGMLADRGGVGHALFSAGIGTGAVRRVLEDLENEARDLYKHRGHKPIINKTVVELGETRTQVRQSRVKGREWKQAQEDHEGSERERAQVEAELRRCRQQQTRAKRIRRLGPPVANLRGLQKSLDERGEVTALPDGFPERRGRVVDDLRRAEENRQAAERRVADTEASLEGLEVPEPLLAQATAIDDLREDRGKVHTATTEHLPRLKTNERLLLDEAEALLGDLGLETPLAKVGGLRCPKALSTRLHDLAAEHRAVVDGLDDRRRALHKLQHAAAQLGGAEAGAAPPVDTARLEAALATTRKLGDLEARQARLALDRDTAAQTARARVAHLAGGLGVAIPSLEAAEQLALPSSETLDRFEGELNDIEQRAAQVEARRDELTATRTDLDLGLRQAELAGAPPTEDELAAARSDRDGKWAGIRQHWQAGLPVAAGESIETLSDGFEATVRSADQMADRLRREADRVAQKAGLVAQRERVGSDLVAADEMAEALAGRQARWNEAWCAAWAGATAEPTTPREMRVVVRTHAEVVALAEQIRASLADEALVADEAGRARGRIGTALAEAGAAAAGLGESLAALVDRTGALVKKLDRQRVETLADEAEAKRVRAELSLAQTDLHEAEARLQQWNEGWATALGQVGLAAHSSPAEVVAALEQRQELLNCKERLDDLGRRIFGIERDASRFETTVAELVEQAAPDLRGRRAVEAIAELNRRLVLGQREATRRTEFDKQLSVHREDLGDATARQEQLEAELDELCNQAQATNPAELDGIEQAWLDVRNQRADTERLIDGLLGHGDGLSLPQILDEVDSTNTDEISGMLADLDHEVEALEQQRTVLNQRIGASLLALERMDSNGAAAAGAQQTEALLARLGTNVERYVRLRLAARVLREEVERYRKENQGPVLTRASELFRTITVGSFEQLDTDFDASDEPILVGVRGSGERVHIEGMSKGTRDQLYLALRLASIEDWLRSHEPLPLVLDDIFVNFDDERTLATLGLLGELSKRTQILLFTHHKEVVDLAGQAAEAGRLQVHDLAC